MSDELKPWTIRSSRTIVKDKWIDLTAESCVTPRGELIEPFYLLKPRDWCCIMAIDAEDHVIFVRQYRHGIRATSLELPGGVIDEVDASPATAAARELMEETGYGCGPAETVGTFSANPHNHTNFMHVFLARGAARCRAPNPDFGEALAIERHPVGSIDGLIRSGAIVHGLQIAALVQCLHALGR